MNICHADGCSRAAHAKGLCTMHYQHLKNGGALTAQQPARERERWVLAHAADRGGECLKWPFGASDTGRGIVYFQGHRMSAPRAMCIAAHGPPPTPQHEAAHSCGQGHAGCMAPRHIRWTTRAENAADMAMHGTRRRGEAINTNKLTADDVLAIRASSDKGIALADKYGVTPAAISNILLRKCWDWI